ncbi:MFS transporter [Rubrimonas cliftonensis]|uniref:Predicted arabinose efflux permease, MFS family n=1 Tax=Rubrimonas cliftonensis TaxID=89524 RepID=A0A1H4DU37_9RHOB|nr:MFS transporter [Rubrimonas cliftonensis]SEA76028.1 Predicted arabinose efflux permease, MFS family [Rubrimonas cliftonensis]
MTAAAAARRRAALGLGLTQTLAWGASYYLPAILAAPMARDLGVSTPTVFAAFSVALLLTAALGPAVGRWIDRRGGRPALTASNLIFAAGLVGLALAQGPATLFAAWLVMGLGMATGLYEAAFAALAAAFGREARGPITGVALIAGFASTVCWPASAWMEAEFGWRGACLVWAALHLVFALPLNRLLAPPRAAPKARASDASDASAAPPAADAAWTSAALAFVFAATWIVSVGLAAHLPRLLEEAGATPAAALAAAALVGPAQVGARLLEFGLMRRMNPLVSARLACLAHPLGAAALAALGAPAAAALTVLHGAGNGVMTIAKGTLPLALFGPEGYGRRTGLLMAPARLGQAAAPLGFALLIDAWGAWTFAVTSGLMFAGFVVLMALGPRR